MDNGFETRSTPDDGEEPSALTPRDAITFLLRSARRHYKMGRWVALAVAALGIAVAYIIPPKYESESRILAVQSALVTSALSNPNRPSRETDPFSGSTEILMKKSNLLWIAKESDLLSSWNSARKLPLRWKDSAFKALFGAPTQEGQYTAISEMLMKQMYVTHDPSLLTIHAGWVDPEGVLRIVKTTQNLFLKLRKEQELSAITAAINVNDNEVKKAAEGVDQALQELIRLKETRRSLGQMDTSKKPAAEDAGVPPVTQPGLRTRAPVSRPTSPTGKPDAPSGELTEKKLASQLAEVRAKQREIEQPWQQRLAELKYQLNDLRAVYGPEHPQIVSQEAKIRQASERPAELNLLKAQEQQILVEIEVATRPILAPSTSTIVRSIQGPTPAAVESATSQSVRNRLQSGDGTLVIAEREEDPVIAPATANLTAAISRYEEATRRLETARLELITSQASLEYRYTVVAEPERPNKPTKPKRGAIAAGAIGAALLLGFLAGAIRDLLTGKIFEPWQVKVLNIPLLGELDFSSKAQRR